MSAIAAAIGLVVGGVASWASVKTLEEQRQDSAEAAELRKREQASKVAAWLHGISFIDGTITVANYSNSPLPRWSIHFGTTGGNLNLNRNAATMGYNFPIPPCTRVILDIGDTRKALREVFEETRRKTVDANITHIQFEDAAGGRWNLQLHSALWEGPQLTEGWIDYPRQGYGELPVDLQPIARCS